MPQSFGNIKDTPLKEVISNSNFKKYWNITKDDIKVCEFRYVCTDCRAYTEDPNDLSSKPLKCGYNPYTNVWEGWSTNPLKQKAIEYYSKQDLIKKDEV
jgi:SPASM domain peptide maturase of grasp-with-spasm system